MAKLRMLPGESVVHRLRPSPLSFAPAYAVAALHVASGWLLHALLTSPAWSAGSQGSAWRFWSYLYGNAFTGTVLGLLVLAGGAFAFAWALHARRLALALGAGLSLLLLALLLLVLPYEQAVPWSVAGAGIVRLLVTEAHRLDSSILLTNLRLVHRPGFLSGRVAQARYTDIVDLDEAGAGRWLGSGTLVAVLRDGGKASLPAVETFPGVHPFRLVRDLVEVMVQEATSSAALQQEQRTRERKEALARQLGFATP